MADRTECQRLRLDCFVTRPQESLYKFINQFRDRQTLHNPPTTIDSIQARVYEFATECSIEHLRGPSSTDSSLTDGWRACYTKLPHGNGKLKELIFHSRITMPRITCLKINIRIRMVMRKSVWQILLYNWPRFTRTIRSTPDWRMILIGNIQFFLIYVDMPAYQRQSIPDGSLSLQCLREQLWHSTTPHVHGGNQKTRNPMSVLRTTTKEVSNKFEVTRMVYGYTTICSPWPG